MKRLIEQSGLSNEEIKRLIEDNIDSDISFDQNVIEKSKIDQSINEDIIPDLKKTIELDNSLNETEPLKNSDRDSVIEKIIMSEIKQNEKLIDISNQKMDSIIDSIKESEDKIILKEEYFGYSTFSSDPTIFQSSSDLAASPDYIIGPGDEIIIMLWGETEDMSEYIVSRDGYIFIPNIGQVFVNGLDLAGLEKKLKKILQKAYSSLSSSNNNPSTFFDVSLGSIVLKPIRVFVMGEVDQPGAYEMRPSTSLFTSLYYFDGPKISGSLRDIKLIRKGKEIGSIDFYNFLLTGKKLDDIQLQDNDVVFISPRQKTVKIIGEIRRSSIFELKENESFKDLKKIFGGFLSTTYMKRVRLDRILSIEDRIKFGKDRELIDIDFNDLMLTDSDIDIFDGDIITFYKITDEQHKVVTINGPVKRPGSYSIGKTLKVSELLKKADGFINDDVYKEKIDIIRQRPDASQTLITVNLDSVMINNPNHDITLLSNDQVRIYSFSDMIYSDDISIEGYVLDPGLKEYRRGMTIFDLIFLGGGFENIDRLNNTYMERADLLRIMPDKLDLELISFNLDSVLSGHSIAKEEIKMGDKITIYSKEQILGTIPDSVEIDGFIKSPGKYPYAENMTVSDLLFSGSGLDDSSFFNDIFLGRADLIRMDQVKNTRRIISLNLKDFNINNENNIRMMPGDRLVLYSNSLFQNLNREVSIFGQINNPGFYELYENMKLGDLILLAGGFLNSNKSVRIEISSINNSKKDAKIIADVNAYDFVNSIETFSDFSKSILNYRLKANDQISIYSSEIIEYESVSLGGEVYYPGNYTLQSKDEKLSSLIKRAGGITDYANPDASILIRNNEEIKIRFSELIKSPRSKFNISLIGGDSIFVSPRTNIVKIIGQVSSPGTYQYIRGFKLDDYIKLAGGYSKNADKYSTFISYPNGASKKIGFLKFSPKVMDGSIITVLSEDETEPFSFTEYVTNITQIYADLIQAYAVIAVLGR
ncbi:MAG: hypothetical protein CMG57_09585 [Candidatus Marinimicrobia bacterium]|nr:hypothetical protein [Candidatus Neomarinimicrobiota bacterium]